MWLYFVKKKKKDKKEKEANKKPSTGNEEVLTHSVLIRYSEVIPLNHLF